MVEATRIDRVRVLIPAEEISRRRREIAAAISRDYETKDVVLVCILRGSLVFFADLAREITIPVRLDYIGVSSYGNGTSSNGRIDLRVDLAEPITGRHVLLVEDIVDTGRTVHYLSHLLAARGPASLSLIALLDKPARRQVAIEIAYTGFTVPDAFVVGYGLDYDQLYRNLPFIGVLDPADRLS